MDYDKTAIGVENISKINNIVKELEKNNFSVEDIEKVMWKNWSVVLKKMI